MKPKIVIADDGPTIQKVIKITLANEDFDLVECLSADNLMDIVESEKPSLVLLDFNLSDSKTGYDLSKEIKSICHSKIMMLYGTYDTINESLFDEAGVNGHIVKPFDGSKFINLCKQLINDSSLESADDVSNSVDMTTDEPDIDSDDEWVVNQPEVIDFSDESEISSADIVTTEEMSQLAQGMEEWGMDVPGVIGSTSSEVELPPVIMAASPADKDSNSIVVEETLLPANDELEYPDMSSHNPSTSLISIEELDVDESELDIEELDVAADMPSEGIGLDDTIGTVSDVEIANLEAEIADEVETEDFSVDASAIEDSFNDIESDDEDLWAADEVIEDSSSSESIIGLTEEIESEQQIDQQFTADKNIEDKIESLLGPMIEKIVQEKVDRAIEKIAWEVIPDLAENLIKKELKSISDEVMNSL